jgi:hypothetical protein
MAAATPLCDRLHHRVTSAKLTPDQCTRWLKATAAMMSVLHDEARTANLSRMADMQAFLTALRDGATDPGAPVTAYALNRVDGFWTAFPLRGLPLHCLPTHPGDFECRVGVGRRLGAWCHRRGVRLQPWLTATSDDGKKANVDLQAFQNINFAALRMYNDADRLECVAAPNGMAEPALCMDVPVGPAILYRLTSDYEVDTAEYTWDDFVMDWPRRFAAQLHHMPLRGNDERLYYGIAEESEEMEDKYDAVPEMALDPDQPCVHHHQERVVDYAKVARQWGLRSHVGGVDREAVDLGLFRAFINRVLTAMGWAGDFECYRFPTPILHTPPVRLRFVGRRPAPKRPAENAPSPAIKRQTPDASVQVAV